MTLTSILGLIGSILSVSSFFPQVWRIYKTRSAKDISVWMFLLFLGGNVTWIIYGVLMQSFAIIGTNVCLMIMAAAILGMKYRFSHHNSR